MCEVNDKEAMSPALNRAEPNAQATEIRIRVQCLTCVNAPRNRCISNTDHVMLLCDRSVDIVNESISGIPARIEVLPRIISKIVATVRMSSSLTKLSKNEGPEKVLWSSYWA